MRRTWGEEGGMCVLCVCVCVCGTSAAAAGECKAGRPARRVRVGHWRAQPISMVAQCEGNCDGDGWSRTFWLTAAPGADEQRAATISMHVYQLSVTLAVCVQLPDARVQQADVGLRVGWSAAGMAVAVRTGCRGGTGSVARGDKQFFS